MLRPKLEGTASIPQESPDIVIMTGHTPLQHLVPREKTTLHPLGDMPRKSKGLDLSPFDLPVLRA